MSLTRDSFTVNLQSLSDGRYDRACSCGSVGLHELACPHAYAVLRHLRMEGSFPFWMKKWRLVETWLLQLGIAQLGPSGQIPELTSEMVLSKLRSMRDDGSLPSSTVPKIKFCMPGRPTKAEQVTSRLPKGTVFDEMRSVEPRADPKADTADIMKVAMKRTCPSEHPLDHSEHRVQSTPSIQKCGICSAVGHTAKTCEWAKNYADGALPYASVSSMLRIRVQHV